jgi:hypothetical protein
MKSTIHCLQRKTGRRERQEPERHRGAYRRTTGNAALAIPIAIALPTNKRRTAGAYLISNARCTGKEARRFTSGCRR